VTRRGPSFSASLRPIGMPRAIEVRTAGDGLPLAVVRLDARGHRSSEARVESIEEMWRLAEAWWREPAQARTYYRVALEDRRLLTIYQDDAASGWYEQPYTDPHAP
jgi:hypothetical protein